MKLHRLFCVAALLTWTTAGHAAPSLDPLRDASLVEPRVQFVGPSVRAATFAVPVSSPEPIAAALSFLDEFSDALMIGSPLDNLAPARHRQSGDRDSVFFSQRLSGLRVLDAEAVVRLEGDEAVAFRGHLAPVDSELPGSLTPQLNSARAKAYARAAFRGPDGVVPALRLHGEPFVVLFDPELGTPAKRHRLRLAYAIEMSVAKQSTRSWRLVLDAVTGAVLERTPLDHTVLDLDVETADHWATDSLAGLTCWLDAFTLWQDDVYDEGGLVSGASASTELSDARTFAIEAYNYLRDQHGWLSVDDHDQQLELTMQIDLATRNDHALVNAFWSPGCQHLEFGDDMATQDILAHEMTHGVINHTSDLKYESESGALNESYADVFGALIDYSAGDTTNWQVMGEGSPAGTIRDLSNPPALGQPDHVSASKSNDAVGQTFNGTTSCDTTNDQCGVHNNSGIPNKAFYLIAEGGTHTWASGGGVIVAGIGKSKAADLYFEVMTNRLSRNSDFGDAATETVDAAKDFRADGSFDDADVCAVINALYAVGMRSLADADCDGDEDGDATDDDLDLVFDSEDNCPETNNGDQADLDGDGQGDACDSDDDGDAVPDARDNCPDVPNFLQQDVDGNGIGNACQDSDDDGVLDSTDNCDYTDNADQQDHDADGAGDACDSDDDNDGVRDTSDNCDFVANVSQADGDRDGVGSACDNCLLAVNASQEDADSDGRGNACDLDDDGDGIPDAADNCPTGYNPTQLDADRDGRGSACDGDDLDRLTEGLALELVWQDLTLSYDPTTFMDRYVLEVPLVVIEGPTCDFCPPEIPADGLELALDLVADRAYAVQVVDAWGRVIVSDFRSVASKTLDLHVMPAHGTSLRLQVLAPSNAVARTRYEASLMLRAR